MTSTFEVGKATGSKIGAGAWRGSAFAKISGLVLALVLCCAFANTRRHCAEAAAVGEYQIKAVFLYNFAKFVEWPSSAFADANSPIVIAVLGEDPFGSSLEQVVKGKTVGGRRFSIKRFEKIRDLEPCHILFISSSESGHLSKALDSIKGPNVLTVSEIERFAQRGGIIGFVVTDNKVGFEINLDAAKKVNLKLSSKLLKVARVVRD
ncbi:MAG: YfiR family protein [Armatimonadota bacterium]|nr:YfiR family protein [Armatimonadota bacterium]